MVNSDQSHSSKDQVPPSTHEEAWDKVTECAMTLPTVQELATKVVTEAFKAATSHEEEDKFADYMKGGACKESFMAHAECPEPDKQKAMLDCMNSHSDYYHKYSEIIEEQAGKQLESIFPGGEGDLVLGVHDFFTKGEGGCCKEQYTAWLDCLIEEASEKGQFGPSVTTFFQRLFTFL